MATGHFIRDGDKTCCGGKVLAGNRGTVMNGMPHAREGDPVTCGKDGKTYEIVGGVNIIIITINNGTTNCTTRTSTAVTVVAIIESRGRRLRRRKTPSNDDEEDYRIIFACTE